MGAGINNDNAEIQNFGKLIIGAIANINGYGIKTSDGSFINYTNGDIKIDRTNSIAFWNISGGIFNNYGKVAIGSSGNIGETGFQNNGLFNNRSNSEMVINRATEEAIRNNSPSSFFTNSGKIQIGTIISSGKYGINNSSRLDNEEGEISIDRVGAGIRNDNLGTFTNYAKLVIGPLSGLANYGISNGGVFANNVNGLITIERVSGYGIETDGQTIGSFTNEGKIVIGTNAALFLSGIYNNAAFENKKGAEIQINHVTHAGIQNVTPNSRPFKNNGKILIGQTAAAGKYRPNHPLRNSQPYHCSKFQ
jgi:hypothetical protein